MLPCSPTSSGGRRAAKTTLDKIRYPGTSTQASDVNEIAQQIVWSAVWLQWISHPLCGRFFFCSPTVFPSDIDESRALKADCDVPTVSLRNQSLTELTC